MHFEQITGLSFQEFQQAFTNKKVLLLHPATRYRNVFLAFIMAYAGNQLLYYRSAPDTITLSGWLRNLATDLDLTVIIPEKLSDNEIPTISKTLLQALTTAYPGKRVLLLDELDYIATDIQFRQFIAGFVDDLPATFQLAVNARLLTHEPWATMCRHEQALVMGTAFRSNDLMYTVEAESRPQLEVYAFGQGHGYMNGQEITQWDGALPRNLFFYFMDRNRSDREDIFAIFWSKLPPREAANVFHVTKRKITERMSELVPDDTNYELVSYVGGFYHTSDKVTRHYDVAEFENACQLAKQAKADDEKEHFYRRALSVYTAPYLETIDMDWVRTRRKRLATQYLRVLVKMGELQKRQGNYAEALGFFLRSLREAPHREDVYCEVMRMYWHLGRIEDAKAQYHMLVHYLDESVGLPPSRKTRDLYDEINAADTA